MGGGVAGECRKTGQQAFPYPMFGRFTHTLSALDRHYPGSFLDNVCFCGQCLPISDRVCVNSRTLDNGKARERISPQTG